MERIGRLDPGLCAFIEVWDEEARERARRLDSAPTATDGPVAGLPLAGLPFAGLPFAVKGPSGIRSYAAQRLIAAGGIPVGSTAVPGPGTYWQTWGQGRHGRTVNPYRADRTPGGSSAGAAVAVATGMVPLATGSDGAGSVRIPAAWCGVFGLKTTNGLLPSPDRTGLASAGVLTRSATEARMYVRYVLTSMGGVQGPRGMDEAAGTTMTPPVPAVFSPDLGFAAVDPEVAAVVQAAVARLETAGVVRIQTHPPREEFTLLDPREAWFAVRNGELPGDVGASGGLGAASAAEGLGSVSARRLESAARVRVENNRRLDALFARTPLLLTPVTPNRPHGHEGPGELYSTALTWAFNLSGHPAASIPAGFTQDGCPVGLQLVADRGADLSLTDIAAAAETRGATGCL